MQTVFLLVLLAQADVEANVTVPVGAGVLAAVYRNNVAARAVFGVSESDDPALRPETRASLYFSRGRDDERHAEHIAAINDYSRALDFGLRVPSLVNRGYVRREVGDLDASANDLVMALGVRPNDALAWYNLGCTNYARRRYDNALSDLTQAIALGADRPGVYAIRGLVYNALHQYGDALIDFDAAIALAPKDPVARVGRGTALSRLKHFDEAIAEFNVVLKTSPTHFDAVLHRGMAWEEKKDYAKAERDFADAARLNPYNAQPHTQMGFAYFDEGNSEQAIDEFSRALDLDHQDVFLLRFRAAAYRSAGNYGAAIADYSEAILAAPRELQNYMLRSESFEHVGNLARAMDDLDTAQKIEPNNLDVYWQRAPLFEKLDAPASAIGDYTSILHSDPDATLARIYRADDFVAISRYDDAQHDYEIASRTDADNLSLLHGKGRLAFYRGQFTEARAHLAHWMKLFRTGRTDESGDQLPYIILWRHLSAIKLKMKDQKELTLASSALNRAKWPYPVIAYFIGEIGQDELLAEARRGSEKAQREQACEANAYIGEQQLALSRNDDARRAFEIAVETCPPDFIERDLARHELGTIAKTLSFGGN